MHKIILTFLTFCCLGGGGAGGWFYFSHNAQASVDSKPVIAEHRELMELGPLFLPIVDESGVSQIISLVVALEFSNPLAVLEAKALEPRIKDAFIQDMYGALNKHAALRGGVIQVAYLKKRLLRASERILGREMVSNILLRVEQERPI